MVYQNQSFINHKTRHSGWSNDRKITNHSRDQYVLGCSCWSFVNRSVYVKRVHDRLQVEDIQGNCWLWHLSHVCDFFMTFVCNRKWLTEWAGVDVDFFFVCPLIVILYWMFDMLLYSYSKRIEWQHKAQIPCHFHYYCINNL